MQRLAPFAVVLCLAACATSAAVPIQQAGAPPAGLDTRCDVKVVFASACCGINGTAHDAIVGQLNARTDLRQVIEYTWGREGERTICIKARSAKAASAVFEALISHRYPSDNHSQTRVVSGDEAFVLEDTRGRGGTSRSP